MRRGALILALAALSVSCDKSRDQGSANARTGEASPSPTVGAEAAPDFTLKDLDGKDVSLSSLRGKALLLNFWAVG